MELHITSKEDMLRELEEMDAYLNITTTDGGKKFYSERLIKYANEVDESYERYAEAGRKGMKARWNKSEPITMLSEKHNDVIQTTPDAKTKEEKEREKETFPPITPYKEKEKAKEERKKRKQKKKACLLWRVRAKTNRGQGMRIAISKRGLRP